LAHRGVLIFDELPEFQRPTIEALRQPLEDRMISVARAKDSIEYPANFIFVATANPCPCGYYGTRSVSGILCDCTANDIKRYRHKLSGPLMDRIDIAVDVERIEHKRLLSTTSVKEKPASNKRLVLDARLIQAERFGNHYTLNSDMSNRDIKRLTLPTAAAKKVLDDAASKLNLSARAYMRTLRVARTIADLDASELVRAGHISEAIQYRNQNGY